MRRPAAHAADAADRPDTRKPGPAGPNDHSGTRRRPRTILAWLLLIPWLLCSPAVRAQTPACNAQQAAALSGAYRTATGAVLSMLPAGVPGQWRIIHFDTGRSHRLHPDSATRFHAASDFESEGPVAFRYAFELGPDGMGESLVIDASTGPTTLARRVPLIERAAAFRSGDVELQGRLTLPSETQVPLAAVIFVHGSDPVPSAGLEWLPHLLATHGIATLVFDKRGTGCSGGSYVQHFDVLADDVVSAARWLEAQPEIDAGRIGLAGFSQGGWVAPLAARKHPGIRYVAVAYGLAMSMADEDRLEAPLKLREQGVDEASVAEFEALNAALHTVAREGFKDWRAFEQLLERARQRPWFAVASQQPSWLGMTVKMGLEQAKAQAPQMFQHFFQPFYDPVPTLEQLDIPMLWLIAGKDMEAPPGPTIAVLERLRGQGKRLTLRVFPNADHGMQDVELRAGKRIRTRFADGYFQTLLEWLRGPN